MKKAGKKTAQHENDARRDVMEDLFFDFNRSRTQIYRINFVRGIFFGFGGVIGGTIVVAIILAILGLLVDLPGGVGDFIKYVVDIVQNK